MVLCVQYATKTAHTWTTAHLYKHISLKNIQNKYREENTSRSALTKPLGNVNSANSFTRDLMATMNI